MKQYKIMLKAKKDGCWYWRCGDSLFSSGIYKSKEAAEKSAINYLGKSTCYSDYKIMERDVTEWIDSTE